MTAPSDASFSITQASDLEAVKSAGFLAGLEVHLWRVSLTGIIDYVELLYSRLPVSEQMQADRFIFTGDRELYIVSHFALRELLLGYLGIPITELRIDRNKYGKPFIPNGRIRFNLSHSKDHALIAFTVGREVGVDIEHERKGIECLELAKRFFSGSEYEELRNMDAVERVSAFYRCWTRKEAYIKAAGKGLSMPLDSFSVPVKRSCRAHSIEDNSGSLWTLSSLDDLPYPAALVIRGAQCRICSFDFFQHSMVVVT